MKLVLFILQTQIKVLSLFSKSLASRRVFSIFQKTYPKKISFKEREFYKNATSFKMETPAGVTNVYEMGNYESPSIFFVHGWNANAGSMAGIAGEFVDKGYHVVLFDLPAHGNSFKRKTTIKECKEVFQAILKRFRSERPITVISHSFGSAVATYALSELNIAVNQMIFLTAPSTLTELFQELKRMLKLNNIIYEKVVSRAESILGESIEDVTIQKKLKKVNFQKLTLIHDRFDKVLPFSNSSLLNEAFENTKLLMFEKIGHYRMLWNEEVFKEISKIDLNFTNQSRKFVLETQECEMNKLNHNIY